MKKKLISSYTSKPEQKELLVSVKGSELLEVFDYGTEGKN